MARGDLISRVIMSLKRKSSPVEDPWTRIVSSETDSNIISFSATGVHCIPHNGVVKIKLSCISAPDDMKVVLRKIFIRLTPISVDVRNHSHHEGGMDGAHR